MWLPVASCAVCAGTVCGSVIIVFQRALVSGE